MFEMKTDGLAEIGEMLSKLEEDAEKEAAQALYIGAGIMAEEIQNGAKGIKTEPFRYARAGETRLPSPQEKAIVMSADGIGIAKFEKDGTEINTSVGYGKSGYAQMAGKTVPIAKVANAINSGTSFMGKQPFVRKAANSGGKKAQEAMTGYLQKAMDAITD